MFGSWISIVIRKDYIRGNPGSTKESVGCLWRADKPSSQQESQGKGSTTADAPFSPVKHVWVRSDLDGERKADAAQIGCLSFHVSCQNTCFVHYII